MVDAPKVFKQLTTIAERIRDDGQSSEVLSDFNTAVNTAVKQIQKLGPKFVAKMPHAISEGIQAITIISPTIKESKDSSSGEKREFIANTVKLMRNLQSIIDEMAAHEKEAVTSILPMGVLNAELIPGMINTEPKKIKDLFKL